MDNSNDLMATWSPQRPTFHERPYSQALGVEFISTQSIWYWELLSLAKPDSKVSFITLTSRPLPIRTSQDGRTELTISSSMHSTLPSSPSAPIQPSWTPCQCLRLSSPLNPSLMTWAPFWASYPLVYFHTPSPDQYIFQSIQLLFSEAQPFAGIFLF